MKNTIKTLGKGQVSEPPAPMPIDKGACAERLWEEARRRKGRREKKRIIISGIIVIFKSFWYF
jgi:hypothetical protein